MGSYDGAEVCELIGSHILSVLKRLTKVDDVGLYRDDGLILLRNLTGRNIELLRKEITKSMKDFGFSIEITANIKQADFLDVTFDLATGTYRPYKKPNDKILYVHVASNHPPNILKQIPESISKRLSRNSSNKEIFNNYKEDYETAIRKSGYKEPLKYIDNTVNTRRKNRSRQIIWFNPPYSKGVSTNVAKQFLELLDKHFPSNNKLNRIFNRNTVKVSYSCTENVAQIITGHNKNKLKPKADEEKRKSCSCHKKDECPLNGNCVVRDVVYQCKVSADNTPDKTYIGLATGFWKERYANHLKSFRHSKYAKDTRLSTHLWKLKGTNNQMPKLRWSVMKKSSPYSNISKRCMICLNEKLAIIQFEDHANLINKRNEAISKCLHQDKYLLKNYKSKD